MDIGLLIEMFFYLTWRFQNGKKESKKERRKENSKEKESNEEEKVSI